MEIHGSKFHDVEKDQKKYTDPNSMTRRKDKKKHTDLNLAEKKTRRNTQI